MEVVRVILEDLLDKFRSKRDLYSMITKDRNNTILFNLYSSLFLATFKQMSPSFSTYGFGRKEKGKSLRNY